MEQGKRTVYIRRKTETGRDRYNEPIIEWGAPTPIRAAIRPLRSVLDAQLYGQRVQRMLMLLYAGLEDITEGTCLCVDVAATDPPDYRVVSVAKWPGHRRLDVERIQDERD
jgi:hypothetical protein